jgi:SAM-dependent methyltransferase
MRSNGEAGGICSPRRVCRHRNESWKRLDHLPPGSRVLDLGSRGGSFHAGAYPKLALIAADLFRPDEIQGGIHFVQADASSLPFASRTFDAIILNHTLEHFERLCSRCKRSEE